MFQGVSRRDPLMYSLRIAEGFYYRDVISATLRYTLRKSARAKKDRVTLIVRPNWIPRFE